VTGWSAGGHLTAFILDHPKVAAGVSISGVFDLAALRDSPHVNDKVKLTETEIETLSPMRRPTVNKPLAIAYGTGELPAMIASSRDYHAYRSQRIGRAIWFQSSTRITTRSWTNSGNPTVC
jgi:dienelactone hydrolase